MLLGHTNTYTLTDSNGYRDGDSYCYTNRDGYRYGHSYSYSYRYRYRERDSDSHRCTDTYPWSDTRCADKSCRNGPLLQPDWSHVD
jgi:hypothetical protein